MALDSAARFAAGVHRTLRHGSSVRDLAGVRTRVRIPDESRTALRSLAAKIRSAQRLRLPRSGPYRLRPYLRVDAYAGTVILLRLRVFDNDGTVQTVQLGRTLDRTHRSVVIDLFAWKALDQIAITTETRTQEKYTVHGSPRGPSIAAR